MEERNIQTDLIKLQTLIGVNFTDTNILLSAVTHRSYLNEHH